MKHKYFSLEQQEKHANLYIYGDITSFPWLESDVSAYNLSKQLEDLKNVDNIDVFINSYGGEVAEGIAIYNALKRFKGKVKTYVDGFACSIASVIFMAGEERVMNANSLLLIHNAWSYECGDANALRKAADDLEKINELSIGIYMDKVNLTKEQLQEYLDKETWINPSEAVDFGFATSIEEEKEGKESQSYKSKMVASLYKNDVKQVSTITISVDENGELVVTTDDGTSITESEPVVVDDEEDDSSNDDGTSTDDKTTNNEPSTDEDDPTDDNPNTGEEEDPEKDNDFKEKLLRVFERGGKE